MTSGIYRSAVRPAATTVAAAGVLSCVVLLGWGKAGGRPGVDPDVLRYSLAGALVAFGVLVPGILALRRMPAPLWGAVGFFLALTANAVVLGGEVVPAPGTGLLLLSIVVCLGMSTLGLVAVGEAQRDKPSRSRF